jgi:hypothetical protein
MDNFPAASLASASNLILKASKIPVQFASAFSPALTRQVDTHYRKATDVGGIF